MHEIVDIKTDYNIFEYLHTYQKPFFVYACHKIL